MAPWHARSGNKSVTILSVIAAVALVASACASEGATQDASEGATQDGSDEGPIRIGSLLDETGGLNIYGGPMKQATELAVADLNANGGLLGREIELIAYDTQSDDGRYTDLANRLAVQDEVDIVMGGIASSSREALRPVLSGHDTLYFYNAAYEGGVCDKNTFITGSTLNQSISALVPFAIEEYGDEVYTVAADYNFGQIGAEWIERFTNESGGEVLRTDLVPLSNSDFSGMINEIQQQEPDLLASMLVGADHVAFYRAFAAAGMNEDIPIISESFGLGNEQQILSTSESDNTYVGAAYATTLENEENEKFKARWAEEYPDSQPTSLSVDVWNGYHLWANAVEAAGSVERDAVIEALESGDISFEGPAGHIVIDGPTHHATMDISITVTNEDQGFDVVETFSQVEPTFEQGKCDLIENPEMNEQFVPS